MKPRHVMDREEIANATSPNQDELTPLLRKDAKSRVSPNVVVATLFGIIDDGRTPLVQYRGIAGDIGVRARSVVDLDASLLGRQVVLAFDQGDESKPIIVGVLRGEDSSRLPSSLGSIEVSADGERCIVTAREQLVLRCGRASITLTKAGKVLIEGAYVSTRASGVNRIKGGAVQIN